MGSLLLTGSGVALLVVATLLHFGNQRRLRGRSIIGGGSALVLILVLLSSVALATHTEITSADYASASTPWNGKRVYLSSPRHTTSGQQGECGWEENINGRHWNMYAGTIYTNGHSLHDRTYDVQISGNARDGLLTQNVSMANNWGADVYIVTHTNAVNGCPESYSYVRAMWRTGVPNSSGLASELMNDLDPALPGTQSGASCDTLYECVNANASHRSYVELFFHSNSADKSWFQGNGLEGQGGVKESWRYGWAVDIRLGYPR